MAENLHDGIGLTLEIDLNQPANCIPDNSYYQECYFLRIKRQVKETATPNTSIRPQIQASAILRSEIQSAHLSTERGKHGRTTRGS
jgi:hypothetical protein